MSLKKLVFLGPSLSFVRAQAICPDAIFLPPARCGDVLEAIKLKPDVILLIDGFFEATPAIWHKEILFALSQGIAVWGASSMGALRAAELADFGMHGIGQIYEWYESHQIQDDDEVALAHLDAEHQYLPISEAMVNLRASFTAPSDQDMLIQAKAIDYRKRQANILNLDKPLINQKSKDAELALATLAKLNPKSLESLAKIAFPHSLFFKGLIQQVFCRAPTLPKSVLTPQQFQLSQTRLFGPCYKELTVVAKLLFILEHITSETQVDPSYQRNLKAATLFNETRFIELAQLDWLEKILQEKYRLQNLFSAYFQKKELKPSMATLKKYLKEWQTLNNLNITADLYAHLEAHNVSVPEFEAELVLQTLLHQLVEKTNLLLQVPHQPLSTEDYFAKAFTLTNGQTALKSLNQAEIKKRIALMQNWQENVSFLNVLNFVKPGDLSHFIQSML